MNTSSNRGEMDLSAQILQSISVPTFVIDKNHTVTHWNAALEKLTGIPATSIIGTKNHWRAFYRSERALMDDLVVDNADESVITGHFDGKCRRSPNVEEAYEAEIFFPDMCNGGKWMIITAAPILDADGHIIGAVQTLLDITERKLTEDKVRESEKRHIELSITDSLTKLYNSRHFFRQLRQEVEMAERYNQPLSLLLLDIDDFKNYNDTYGHMEGDKVLALLADVIRKNLRSTDSGYRYGGEEFTVLMPHTDRENILTAAERFRQSFANTPLLPLPGIEVRMTVSIGTGQYQPGETTDAFVKRVDAGMYRAKKSGKNRVSYAD